MDEKARGWGGKIERPVEDHQAVDAQDDDHAVLKGEEYVGVGVFDGSADEHHSNDEEGHVLHQD